MQLYALQLESILPMLVPMCTSLAMGFEGLERLFSLEGEAFRQSAGPDCFSRQSTDWDTMDSGSEEQATVCSPNTLSTLVPLHVTSGHSR